MSGRRKCADRPAAWEERNRVVSAEGVGPAARCGRRSRFIARVERTARAGEIRRPGASFKRRQAGWMGGRVLRRLPDDVFPRLNGEDEWEWGQARR